MSDVLLSQRDRVATLTLNRPERLNAISGPMLEELSRLLVTCNTDRDVRVIVLTGAGRGLCAGLDLQSAGGNDLGSPTSGAGTFRIEDSPPFVLRRIETPVVCALNGPAAGYGMDLALGCDLLIAAESASFAPPIRRAAVADEWADELAAQAPLAVRANKRLMRLGQDATFEANSHHAMAEIVNLFRTADFAEGIQAFLEQRPPSYQGR